jgi:hypothetical protein
MRRLFLTAATMAIAAVTVGTHANSVSYANYVVDGRSVHVVVRLPLDDVDLLLRLDRDLDGQVSGAELEASSATVRGYLAKHMRVTAEGTPIPESLVRVATWRDASAFQYLESEWWYRAPRGVALLSIHTDFLTELYPSHQTLGHITAGGLEERFTFDSRATFQRRIGSDRTTTIAMVIGGLVVLGALVLARRRTATAVVAMLLVAAAAQADVILSGPALNTTLKAIEKLKRQTESGADTERAEAWFRLGAEADGLASIMNLEVESHGMQERELLDLALGRTKELGVAIVYSRDKKKFFYDGAARPVRCVGRIQAPVLPVLPVVCGGHRGADRRRRQEALPLAISAVRGQR